MEFEFWWLVAFPVFFGMGWLAARIDIRQLLSESRTVPRSYFKGLNFLLTEQHDKAIDAFIEVVKVDPETVELHFALGNLFRRRGEVDRAIRMHQNLVERADLAEEQKVAALFELGQDYLKAGLLDRAEDTFARLRASTYEARALQHLLEIYEQEKDWLKAIDTAREIAERSGQPRDKEIANFYCELAAGEITHSRFDAARGYLEQALQAHRKCVRANLLRGDLELAAGRRREAIEAWKRVEAQRPAYLSLVANRLLDAYREDGRFDEGLGLLRGYLAQHPSLDLLNAVFVGTLDREGPQKAYRLLRDELGRNPTLLGLDRLLEAQLLETPPEKRRDLELIKNLVHQHTRSLAQYRCDSCGFKARQFYWRCPACGEWETYPPRRTEERELAA